MCDTYTVAFFSVMLQSAETGLPRIVRLEPIARRCIGFVLDHLDVVARGTASFRPHLNKIDSAVILCGELGSQISPFIYPGGIIALVFIQLFAVGILVKIFHPFGGVPHTQRLSLEVSLAILVKVMFPFGIALDSSVSFTCGLQAPCGSDQWRTIVSLIIVGIFIPVIFGTLAYLDTALRFTGGKLNGECCLMSVVIDFTLQGGSTLIGDLFICQFVVNSSGLTAFIVQRQTQDILFICLCWQRGW